MNNLPEYKIIRFKQDAKATLGKLMDEALEICCTLEPPWNNNFRDNPKTKENEASCIPEGRYLCKKFNGVKFQDVWEVTDVCGRTYVLIHEGNFSYQTTACILVGDKHTDYKGIPMVNNSLNTLKKLRTTLPDKFWLEIKCDGFINSLCEVDPLKNKEMRI